MVVVRVVERSDRGNCQPDGAFAVVGAFFPFFVVQRRLAKERIDPSGMTLGPERQVVAKRQIGFAFARIGALPLTMIEEADEREAVRRPTRLIEQLGIIQPPP